MRASLGIQIVSAGNNFVHIAFLGWALPAHQFGTYAIWYSFLLYVLGVSQAVVGESALLGRAMHGDLRGLADGLIWLWTIGLLVLAATVSPVALLAAISTPFILLWDETRFTKARETPVPFLVLDLIMTAVQVVAAVVTYAAGGAPWLVVGVWWISGIPVQLVGLFRLRVLHIPTIDLAAVRHQLPGSMSVGLESILAGLPIPLGLTAISHFGTASEAGGARLALTLLGPLTIVGLAFRRYLFMQLHRNPDRSWLPLMIIGVLPVATLVPLFLSISHLDWFGRLYPAVTPLSWLAISYFVLDRLALGWSFLPVGLLRRAGRPLALPLARGIGLGGAALFVVATHIDTLQAFAATQAISSGLYFLWVFIAVRLLLGNGRSSSTNGTSVAGP